MYAALGTIAHAMPGVFELILEALRDEDLSLILAVGQDPATFGPQPPNVHIERHLPQTQLLARCDVFISHGGFNSVKEALGCGVPLVVVPIMSDEPYSAERCAALGIGRAVMPDERTPDAIGDAVRTLLTDTSYQARTQELSVEMHALPGAERVVELLTSLALERVPTSAQPAA